VHFVCDADTPVNDQTVFYGNTAEEPATPEKDGYRFLGWYKDANNQQAADFSAPVTGNVTYYAAWQERVKTGEYLKALLNGYKMNPYDFIPETMRPGFEETLVDPSDIVTDYSSFVNIKNIPSHGFGEQWDMILTNLQQSMLFFNVLTVVEGLTTTSVTAFNNYLDKNPSETAHYEFKHGQYDVTISYGEDGILFYVLNYDVDIPLLDGKQRAQIALAMDVKSGEKTVRVQLGDANALTYTMTENAYTFAIRYLGVRRAFFTISRDQDGAVQGHIYEYLTVKNVEIASAADFIITDTYVTAVGNKADGMVGFTGYICELYDVENGRMIAYEVRETLKSIVYNTLWFDLDTFEGFETIRYREKTETEDAAFFLNGKTAEWKNKKVGGIGSKMLSRRFDIEFRTQYFYAYDEANDEYVKIAAQVPMLFIQEENYDTAVADIQSTNSITVSLLLSESALEQLMENYDTYVDVFIENKEAVTVDAILAFIGTAVTFPQSE